MLVGGGLLLVAEAYIVLIALFLVARFVLVQM